MFEEHGGSGPGDKMLANSFRPPARLCRHITDKTAPLRSRNCRPITVLQDHSARIGIKIRNCAQQQGFAGARRPLNGDTLAYRQGEGCRFEDCCPEIANPNYGHDWIPSIFRFGFPSKARVIQRCPKCTLVSATFGHPIFMGLAATPRSRRVRGRQHGLQQRACRARGQTARFERPVRCQPGRCADKRRHCP